jgi:hypothetical protein
MEPARALESNQPDVLVVQECNTMLRLSVKCLAVHCSECAPAQRLGGIVLSKRMVHTGVDAPKAHRASVRHILLVQRTAHRRQNVA